MDNMYIRFLVFFLLCIPARLGIAYTSAKVSQSVLQIMGLLMLIPAIGIFAIYHFGNDAADAQLEWLGEKKIWWNNFRPLHGVMYMTFAIMAIRGDKNAWKAIAFDALIGSALFLNNMIGK
jgi:hypothetical protein